MRRPPEPDGTDGRPSVVGFDGALVAALQLEVAQLRQAMLSRQQIGVATGLVAQRFDCSPDRAWSILVRISQDLNVRVRDIAGVLGRAQAGETTADDRELLTRLGPHLPGTSWVRSEPAVPGDPHSVPSTDGHGPDGNARDGHARDGHARDGHARDGNGPARAQSAGVFQPDAGG